MEKTDAIIANTLAILDPRVREIVPLSAQEKTKRLDSCNLSISSSGGLRLPMPSDCENHRDYTMQAFTKFDTATQHAFMRSFVSLQQLHNELEDMRDNGEAYSPQAYTKFSTTVQDIKSATNVMLIEREAEMVNANEIPKHSTGHATYLILVEDELTNEFYKKYKHQLRDISEQRNAESVISK